MVDTLQRSTFADGHTGLLRVLKRVVLTVYVEGPGVLDEDGGDVRVGGSAGEGVSVVIPCCRQTDRAGSHIVVFTGLNKQNKI